MKKYNIDTLPPNDGAAAAQVANDLQAAGEFTEDLARSIRDGLVFSEEIAAFHEGLRLPVSPAG